MVTRPHIDAVLRYRSAYCSAPSTASWWPMCRSAPTSRGSGACDVRRLRVVGGSVSPTVAARLSSNPLRPANRFHPKRAGWRTPPAGALDLHPIGLALLLEAAALAVFVLALVRLGIVGRAELVDVARALRLRAGA